MTSISWLVMHKSVYDKCSVWFRPFSLVTSLEFSLYVLVLTVWMCVCDTQGAKGRRTMPYEVFIHFCLTCSDAGCIPVNQCRWQKIIQNQLTDRSYHLQLSLLRQSNKCNQKSLLQIIWHLKAGRCRERGLFRARPSGLFWPVFQRSTVWLSYHNYFSRTNLFIDWAPNLYEPASKTGQSGRGCPSLARAGQKQWWFSQHKWTKGHARDVKNMH